MVAMVVGKESRHSGPKTRPASSRRWQLADSAAGLLKISRLSGRMPMPQQVRGVVVDPAVPGKLTIKPVELRDPDRDEVAVRVTAISLNRGETRRAVHQAEPGWRPGWDFAGVAETAAADGSGPRPGTRVVGILPSGAWAERVNCRTHAVAALPDALGDAEAATLPVAGLTALHALRQGGLLLGRKVLVDGASGGVGHLACQLAMAAGAQVWGHVRREEYRAAVAAATRSLFWGILF